MGAITNVLLGICVCALLLAGCVADPSGSSGNDALGDYPHAVLIVNEGLWRQDNSTLTLYDPGSASVVRDYFSRRNPGMRLGDTGNDIVVKNNRAYIVVSTSRIVEILDLPSGRSLGRVQFPGGELRYLTVIDDSTAFVTTRDDDVVEFNPLTMRVGRRFRTGPAPEGVAYTAGRIFVANSALGRLRQDEPKANTVSVLNLADGEEVALLALGNNPWTLRFLPANSMMYLLSRPVYPDSLAALVEIDPVELIERRRWEFINPNPAEMAFDDDASIVYLLAGKGVLKIDLSKPDAFPEILIDQAEYGIKAIFDIGVAPDGGDIYLSDAKQYTTNGNVLIFNREGRFKNKFECGLNPGAFGFY